jgi:hypothetical protein
MRYIEMLKSVLQMHAEIGREKEIEDVEQGRCCCIHNACVLVIKE